MSAATDVVDRLIAGWGDKDIEAIMACFTDDAVYINIPMDPPNEGKDMIRGVIEGFVGMSESIDWTVHNQGESGDGVVFNERTDNFAIGGKTISIRVMGVFETRDGLITAWRDYFDLSEFESQMAG